MLARMMQDIVGVPPEVWQGKMIGFGRYSYQYPSGRAGEWFLTGFANRKASLVVYLLAGCEAFPELLEALGPYTAGQSCLYINRLADVDEAGLRELITASVKATRAAHPA